MENRISLELTEAEKTAVNGAIATLLTVLKPYLIALSPEERKTMAKISDEGLPFVEKVAQYVVKNPEFTPLFGDADEFKKDVSAFTIVHSFVRQLLPLIGNLEDTAMLAGSEADDFARRYYGAVGQAAKMGVPNAQAIYDDLSARYAAQKKKRPRPVNPAA